jgi:hypothetical protein
VDAGAAWVFLLSWPPPEKPDEQTNKTNAVIDMILFIAGLQ